MMEKEIAMEVQGPKNIYPSSKHLQNKTVEIQDHVCDLESVLFPSYLQDFRHKFVKALSFTEALQLVKGSTYFG